MSDVWWWVSRLLLCYVLTVLTGCLVWLALGAL